MQQALFTLVMSRSKEKKSQDRMLYIFFVWLALGQCIQASPDMTLRDLIQKNIPDPKTGTYVTSINWKDQRIWIKTVDQEKSSYSHCVKSWALSLVLPGKMYAPTVACGDDLLAIEAKRLKECEAKKGPCVRLVDQGKNWIAVTDGGTPLRCLFGPLSLKDRLELFKKCLQGIHTLHTHGIVHGRGDVRDIMIQANGKVCFIDFAEDPLDFLSFDEAQCRDLLCFFITALPHLDEKSEYDEAFAKFFWKHLPRNLYSYVWQVMHHIESFHQWTSYLKRWYPKSASKALRAVETLKAYATPDPRPRN